jgi:alpha-glucosidase
MPVLRLFLLFLFISAATLVAFAQVPAQNQLQVVSPSGQIVFVLSNETSGSGQAALRYSVDLRGKRLIDASELGLEIQGRRPLGPALRQVGALPGSADEDYTIPVGKTKNVRNHYNSLIADFEGGSGTRLSVEVRAFDDGVAFRYATHTTFTKRPVDRTTILDIHMVSGGGNVVWIHPEGK